MTVDRDVLASVFAARVSLAKKSEAQVVQEAKDEWERTVAWVNSKSRAEGSFLDLCDEFGLEPSAVRRAIKEKS